MPTTTTTHFSIGDSVLVSVRAQGGKFQKTGKVEAIVQPYSDLPDSYREELALGSATNLSGSTTYIVRVPHASGKGKGKAHRFDGAALTPQKTCIGCGAKQEADGLLACGH